MLSNDLTDISIYISHEIRMIACDFELTYSLQILPRLSFTLRWRMKRVKLNYHALHILKTVEPRLRKAIVSKCNGELV